MIDKPVTHQQLATFLRIKEGASPRVLRELGISLRGGTTRWTVVWRALGLNEVQDPQHHASLTEALLDAAKVAELIGVSTSIIYRWNKGILPKKYPRFPTAIDLSNGREMARALRWRKSEVLAWHEGKLLPKYAKPAPVLGALLPTNDSYHHVTALRGYTILA